MAVGGDPLLVLVLVLLLDVSIAGYLAGRRVGSLVDNVVHVPALPVVVLL